MPIEDALRHEVRSFYDLGQSEDLAEGTKPLESEEKLSLKAGSRIYEKAVVDFSQRFSVQPPIFRVFWRPILSSKIFTM